MSAAPTLPDALRLGAVEIAVTDLDRSIAFYQDSIGLQVHRREDDSAALGAGEEDVLVLREEPDARRAGRHAGLYHFALLHPTREELARALGRLAITRTPIDGASHHGISEAIYLPDPDGNGIELAADRPRDEWPPGWDGRPNPLDLDDLLATVAGEEPSRRAGPGLTVGHLHLHVGDVEQGLAFYRDRVGFELITYMPPTVAFVSAGGYHHHLAFNTWRGQGAPPAPPNAVGLREWTVVLPEATDVAAVRERLPEAEDGPDGFVAADPWGHRMRVTSR